MVQPSDLKCYKTTNFLGGPITGTLVPSANPNNIFGNIPKNELTTGEDYYACVYFKNTHATETMDNFILWISSNSPKSEPELKWAKDPNPVAQTIANKYTAPLNVTWKGAENKPANATHGNLEAGNTGATWLWLHVPANSISARDDNAIFSFSFKIPTGGTGTSGGGDTGGSGGNPPPTVTDYKIAFAGDWGCEPETDDVLDLINAQDYDFVMGVGDNAYESPSCWLNRFDSLNDANKLESCYGNHEYSESGGTSPYKTFFGHSTTYFTFKFRNVQFFVCDTNINCDDGSNQHNFISNALVASQSDNTIKWRVAVFHHPMYGASSEHSYNAADTRQNFHQLFVQNKVNFVVTGHNHNWQRTHQLAFNSSSPGNPTVVDSSSPYSSAGAGFIHVISGTGGHDTGSGLYSLGSQPSYQAFQNRSHNGVWEMVSTNSGSTLTCRFRDIDGDTYDTFTIS